MNICLHMLYLYLYVCMHVIYRYVYLYVCVYYAGMCVCVCIGSFTSPPGRLYVWLSPNTPPHYYTQCAPCMCVCACVSPHTVLSVHHHFTSHDASPYILLQQHTHLRACVWPATTEVAVKNLEFSNITLFNGQYIHS